MTNLILTSLVVSGTVVSGWGFWSVVLPGFWFWAGVLGFGFWACTPAAAATPMRARAIMLPNAVN